MNRYGFTLIELLAVIVVLGLITGIAIPNYIKFSNKNKQNQYEEKIKTIVIKGREYAADNMDLINETCPSSIKSEGFDTSISKCLTNVTVSTLISKGYLNGDNENRDIYTNPIKKTSMNACKLILVYTYDESNYSSKVDAIYQNQTGNCGDK